MSEDTPFNWAAVSVFVSLVTVPVVALLGFPHTAILIFLSHLGLLVLFTLVVFVWKVFLD